MSQQLKVAVLGCGLIGERRIRSLLEARSDCPVLLFDTDSARAHQVSERWNVPVVTEVESIWASDSIDAVIVATPNRFLFDYGLSVLASGKHLFVEKPGVCRFSEWERLMEAKKDRIAKIGFNHRFHPAALKLHQEWSEKRPGERPLWMRAAYGHGGRPGYESEWRFDPALSGGGEIIDQGVHLLDLAGWYLKEPLRVLSVNRINGHYRAPVEDNGFLSLETPTGVFVQIHCSVTQWKNLFRFELASSHRLFVWEGLGNASYGEEVLTVHERLSRGGAPLTQRFLFNEEKSDSWTKEWDQFRSAILGQSPCGSELSEMGWLFQTLDEIHQNKVRHIG